MAKVKRIILDSAKDRHFAIGMKIEDEESVPIQLNDFSLP